MSNILKELDFPNTPMRFRNYTCLLDELPENVITKKERKFESFVEMREYFTEYEDKILDYRNTDWEVPYIKKHTRNIVLTDKCPLFTFGDRIITKDYEVHKVIGFNTGRGTKLYFSIE